MEALEAIQEAFKKSGITEEELLETAHRIREKRALEKYGSRV
jgi:DNA-binding protein H-NS